MRLSCSRNAQLGYGFCAALASISVFTIKSSDYRCAFLSAHQPEYRHARQQNAWG
jgi:hypothetical protein